MESVQLFVSRVKTSTVYSNLMQLVTYGYLMIFASMMVDTQHPGPHGTLEVIHDFIFAVEWIHYIFSTPTWAE